MTAPQRIRQSSPATLAITTVDQYGVGTDRTGDVTVTVTNAAGTALLTDAATVSAGEGVYTVDLTAASTGTLDELACVWTDVDNDVAWHSSARIVGGFLFTIAEARAYDTILADDTKYPNDMLALRRDEVEAEAEWICDRSFVPAFRKVTVDGQGTTDLVVGIHDVRTVRKVTVYESIGGTGVDLTSSQLASIITPAGGTLRRTDGGTFPFGQSNVVVHAEYGLDAPSEDMVIAAITRLRSRLRAPQTGLPERARSMTDGQGNSYQLGPPDPYSTGIDSVDSVYGRYSMRRREAGAGGATVVPSSRTLSYDPQWYGLFRGGPR